MGETREEKIVGKGRPRTEKTGPEGRDLVYSSAWGIGRKKGGVGG